MNRKSCDNCREGIRCRACGAVLKPLPGLLTARDYTLMLALIDGSDRKYPCRTVDTVRTILRSKDPKAALYRLRVKLRRLLAASQSKPQAAGQVAAGDPESAREEILRRAKAGEFDWDEAETMLLKLEEGA